MSSFRSIELSDPAYEFGNLRFLTFKSPALKGRGDVTLYVPEGCENERGLPVMLLLHGVVCSHWSWALKGGAHVAAQKLINTGKLFPLVIAMPSDGLWGDGSGYIDQPEQHFEQWIMSDVIRCVDEVLPCADSKSGLYIAGLSMGGFGALRLGAKYADRFKAISAHSSVTSFHQINDFVEEPIEAYGPVDPGEGDVLAWMVKNKDKLPPVRFDCGRDDILIDMNRELHACLDEQGIPHTYEEFDGQHSWDYWAEHIYDTLRFFNSVKEGGR